MNHNCTCKEISRTSNSTQDFGYTEVTYSINPECDVHGIPSLHRMLAECYKLTGADPDGNEDWRLAPLAVDEVRRLRKELDDSEDRVVQLEGYIQDLEARIPLDR